MLELGIKAPDFELLDQNGDVYKRQTIFCSFCMM